LKKVAVVILNYNGKKYLQDFLPTLIKYNPDFAEVIIADNCSTDDSIQFLKTEYPSLKTIINTQNHGFAGGYNTALNQLEHEYFILINSDVEVTENWTEALTTFMDGHPNVSACQPKIRDYHHLEKFEYAGAAGGYMDYLGYPFCRGRIFGKLEVDNNQYNDAVEIFWATGACMMVRAEVFKKLGGFDAHFFAHQEEIDLCWRMRNKGYKIMYVPNATVYHIGGGTLSSTNPKKTYLNFRNSLLSIIKNVPKKYLISSFLLRLFFDGLAGIQLLIQLKPTHTFAIIKAHFSVYKNFFGYIKKRENIPKELPSCFYTKSLVIDYFIRGKKKFTDLDESYFTELPSSK
jgi:hypothetical protein